MHSPPNPPGPFVAGFLIGLLILFGACICTPSTLDRHDTPQCQLSADAADWALQCIEHLGGSWNHHPTQTIHACYELTEKLFCPQNEEAQ